MTLRNLSPAEFEAIDKAVRSTRGRIGAEDRFDLRQELAIKLAASRETFNSLDAALREWAANAASDLIRSRRAEREMLRAIHAAGSTRRYRVGDMWEPKWYPPHAEARESNPLACKGARVMHVSVQHPSPHYEDDFLQFLDSTRLFARMRQSRAMRRKREERLSK